MKKKPDFAFDTPSEALAALLERLGPVGLETVPIARARGRVLAQSVRADRPSPPLDVSAMDGYAVRAGDLDHGVLPVAGEVVTGRTPPGLPEFSALRIFTGGAVPAGAEAVIPREELIELEDSIRIPDDLRVSPGQHIRRQGENLAEGAEVLSPGQLLRPPSISALAAFGCCDVEVHRKVRVAVVVTGNELTALDERPGAAQIRDSNGPAIDALLGQKVWIEVAAQERAPDDLGILGATLERLLAATDAVVLTGGVSMGDHDLVREAIEGVGAEVVFHWLPVRPGKPVLTAVGPNGQLVLGLPGNPVSALVTARRFGLPALGRRAGLLEYGGPDALLSITNPDEKTLPLHWHRIVRRLGADRAALAMERGSGDLAALAGCDGFVHIEPGVRSKGSFPYYAWDA